MNTRFKICFKNIKLAILLMVLQSSLSWAISPGKLIVEKFNESSKILKDPSLQGSAKKAEREQKLWKVLKPIFDFKEIARRCLAQHWKNHTAQERKEFTEVFTEVLKSTYLDRTDSYSGEKIVFIKERVKNNHSKVQTNFITKDGKKVSVNFNLKKKNGNWKIYDVIVEGVSTIANYRSQFNSILSKSSLAELIKKLKEKEKELSSP